MKGVLGLPDGVSACLFDLDGVLTDTARLHAAAWEEMFDEFLRRHGAAPFDPHADYDEYVDGRPRLDGVRSFLKSRAITLPEGSPDDPPGTESVASLARRKNDLVLEAIRKEGVKAYPGSVEYVKAARDASLHRAVVSASANCRDVLRAAGIEELFEQIIDGHVAQREQLAGKPAPDTYLAAARALSVEPGAAAVFEDALAGVQAGRAGAFALVVGVDRVGQAEQLKAHGADVVVSDLAQLLDAG